MKKSKWFFWSFLPFFNFAAWIHAGIRTGRNSYYWLAAVYALPFTVAIVMGMVEEGLGLSKETTERVTDFGSTAAAVLWIAGMIHALLKKDTVDQQIQSHEIGKAQSVLGMEKLPDKIPAPLIETPRPQPHETTTPASAPQPMAASTEKAAKKGTILDYGIQKSEGIISGDDNNRYKFAGSEWRASGAPARGQRVNFEVVDGRAVDVS
jgi:hypothetical protein